VLRRLLVKVVPCFPCFSGVEEARTAKSLTYPKERVGGDFSMGKGYYKA
jgi:hypothetical protein